MKKFLKIAFLVVISFVLPLSVFYAINMYLEPSEDIFAYNKSICGVELKGLTKKEAETQICNNLNINNNNIELTLVHNNNTWVFKDADFKVNSNIHTILDDVYKANHKKAFLFKNLYAQKIKNMGFDNKVAFNYVFVGMQEKIKNVINQVECLPINASAQYNPQTKSFEYESEVCGIKVDEQKLYEQILESLKTKTKITINVPTISLTPEISKQDLIKNIVKQSTFSTNYSKSNSQRKNNIKIATNKLNGFEVKPGQIFSFNEAVGKRLQENGYKEANIIKDGEFVKGVGGGVCQVSTTLYNALLLANIEVAEVHKHSLPVSYVDPALDAMVSWGSADLKFKNTTNYPIFITSICDGNSVGFSVYGSTKPTNLIIKTRSEILKTIPAGKDEIKPDTSGKYADKIMFKGEFIRVKAAKNGYVAQAYLDYYENGKLTTSKLIRTGTYEPQNGIVYEGCDTLPEGLTLPKNNVYN